MDFKSFPTQWEWVALIVAAVGTLMALPTFVQMFWGRPLLRTRFERHVEGANRLLMVFLDNPPVRNWFLRRIGVRRETIQSLTVSLRISEAGSGHILRPIQQARIYSDDDPTDQGNFRVALPPTFSVAASIAVVSWDSGKKTAFVPPDRLHPLLVLQPGYYRADFAFLINAEPSTISRRFVVGENADDLNWSAE